MRVQIRLETESDVRDFSQIAENCGGEITLCGKDRGTKCSVNARSIVGVMYSMSWDEIWCESEKDIYSKIDRFVVLA